MTSGGHGRQILSPTLLAALAAILIAQWPASTDWLVFDRGALLHGQVWRLWTGHLVHFSLSHLIWNLAVTVFAGLLLERRNLPVARRLYLVLPPAIGVALLVFDPRLSLYGGLSGIATGLVACVGLQNWHTRRKVSGCLLLLLVAVKTALEFDRTEPLFAIFTVGNILGTPLAHLAGVIVGAYLFYSRRRRTPPPGSGT